MDFLLWHWALLATVILVGAAFVLACIVNVRRFFSAGPSGLSLGEAQVLGAWIEAALSTVEWRARVNLEDLYTDLGIQMSGMPKKVRRAFAIGLIYYNWAPRLLGQTFKLLSALPNDKRRRVIQNIEHTRWPGLAELQDGIATLCMLILGGKKEVLQVANIARAEWVRDRQRTRSKLLTRVPS